jgi:hypothetical protein
MKPRHLTVVALLVSAAALTSSSSGEQIIPSSAHCRHDSLEQPMDRQRREAALAVARAINAAEGLLVERTRTYHPLTALRDLPTVPVGFELRFYSDSAGYMFALKDTLDSCRYAVFSDQSGLLYEKAARTAPVVATE